MLWKSLAIAFGASVAIASLLVLNTAPASWSLELAGQKRPARAEKTAEIAQSLFDKMSEAENNEKFPEVERIARQILRQDPQNEQANYFLGIALKGQRKFAAAESLYRQNLRKNPDSHKDLTSLVQILQEQKKFDEAESLYRQHISKNPVDFQAYRELGQILAEQGKPDAALTVYRQAIAANPANSYIDLSDIQQDILMILARLDRKEELIAFTRQRLMVSNSKLEIINVGSQLSSILSQQGKIDEAIVVLREVLVKEPGDTSAYIQLGQLLTEQGKELEAIEVYQQAIAMPQEGYFGSDRTNYVYPALGLLLEKQQRFPEALAVYRKIIAKSRLQTTQLLARPGQFREFIANLRRLQQDENFHHSASYISSFPIIGAQISINDLLYKQQGWGAVQKEMQPINQTTPEIAAYILQQFGDKRIAAKQYGEAIVAYQQAAKLDQIVDAYAQGNLFLAWTFANQPQKAKVAYQQALKLIPVDKQQDTIKNWAFALDKAGKKTEAIELYRQLLKSPGKEYLFLSLQLANALEQSGQPAAAEYQQIQVALNKLQRLAPQDPNTHVMQGNLFAQLQQHSQAIDSYRKAIGLVEKQTKKDAKLLSLSQLKLADNLRITGQQLEAIEQYRQAIKGCDCTEIKAYQPSTLHGMAHYGMGLSLEQQLKLPEAKAAFQKALELDPNYEEAQKALMRIKEQSI
jgi:tetratricopeptide (TPR) repeat protein